MFVSITFTACFDYTPLFWFSERIGPCRTLLSGPTIDIIVSTGTRKTGQLRLWGRMASSVITVLLQLNQLCGYDKTFE